MLKKQSQRVETMTITIQMFANRDVNCYNERVIKTQNNHALILPDEAYSRLLSGQARAAKVSRPVIDVRSIRQGSEYAIRAKGCKIRPQSPQYEFIQQ